MHFLVVCLKSVCEAKSEKFLEYCIFFSYNACLSGAGRLAHDVITGIFRASLDTLSEYRSISAVTVRLSGA